MKKDQLRKKNNERGFTLIELTIVIIILGLMAALVAPRMFGKVDKAQQSTTQAQISLLSTACDTFRLDMGRFPENMDELINKVDSKKWEGPYLPKAVPKDPWGNAYEYKCPGDNNRDYDIISYGADGTSGGDGTNADICSWKALGDEDEE